MPATVLDSFALIAYFRGEPGGIPAKAPLQKASAADRPVHMVDPVAPGVRQKFYKASSS